MTDFVLAPKIEAFCRIGCSEEERSFPQRLLVSVKLETNTQKAARTGDLSQTINYATVCQQVREIGAAKPWVLVEELAEAFADQLLEDFSLAIGVHITIEKFILPGVEWVGVEIQRYRS